MGGKRQKAGKEGKQDNDAKENGKKDNLPRGVGVVVSHATSRQKTRHAISSLDQIYCKIILLCLVNHVFWV